MTLPAVTPQISASEYEVTRIQTNICGVVDQLLEVVAQLSQGSRLMALKGVVGQNELAVNGTYTLKNYMAGSAPAFAQTRFLTPFAGSIAGITAKVYEAPVTAGTLNISTVGATTNVSTGPISLVDASYYTTFEPGQYPFSARSNLGLTITSSGWTQAAGATGIEIELWVYC